MNKKYKKGGFIKDYTIIKNPGINTKNIIFGKDVAINPKDMAFVKDAGINQKDMAFVKNARINIKDAGINQKDMAFVKNVRINTKDAGINIKNVGINQKDMAFVKNVGINQKDMAFVKNAGINQKDIVVDKNVRINQKDIVVDKNVRINQKDIVVDKDSRINQKDMAFVKDSRINQKDIVVDKDSRINQKDIVVDKDSRINQKDIVVDKNILQQKKNNLIGVKGDMDGLGKEKGNMNPHFVYLYKNKFEIEAVSNKYDMKGLSPLSGYEPKYNPNYWNNNKNIKNNNNCYSYSVNNKNHKFGKPQPGYFARFNHIQNNQYKCAYFFKRILNDIPSVYLTSFKQKCKNGFHKAFFAIDSNKNEHDYHFYRQDNNQLWSHKPGTTNVINYDADYKIIQNPLKANRNYKSYNYDKPCFFFCVNNKFGKTKAKI
jgi:hypothetical protein